MSIEKLETHRAVQYAAREWRCATEVAARPMFKVLTQRLLRFNEFSEERSRPLQRGIGARTYCACPIEKPRFLRKSSTCSTARRLYLKFPERERQLIFERSCRRNTNSCHLDMNAHFNPYNAANPSRPTRTDVLGGKLSQ